VRPDSKKKKKANNEEAACFWPKTYKAKYKVFRRGAINTEHQTKGRKGSNFIWKEKIQEGLGGAQKRVMGVNMIKV
jgi:hypothetical protein